MALGRAWILFGSKKNPKTEKCSKSRTVPQRPVHALLGGVLEAVLCLTLTRISTSIICFVPRNKV
jgi:hypothetical protein